MAEELPRRIRGDGCRIVEVRRFMPQQEQDNPFEPMLATSADDSAQQDKNQKEPEHAQVK